MRLSYLAVDSLQEGVGASQILPYVERLAARGIEVELHTFEKNPPPADLHERLEEARVQWRPKSFGPFGSLGGVRRVLKGAAAIRGADLVHARSDLAAASTFLARVHRWLWDVRSLYVDQKIELGELRRGSPQEKLLRRVERVAAQRSSAIVTLTEAVLPVLAERYGAWTIQKANVITTCVDTKRFLPTPLPPPASLRFLLAGTVNAYYDTHAMVDLLERARRRRPATLDLVMPADVPAPEELRRAADSIQSVHPHDMPRTIARHHVGLSVCREDAGISLKASMPTKVGEFLASGRPLIVNRGLGDASLLLEEHRCGVVLDGASPMDVENALDRLDDLLADPDLPDRCRALAESHFDLDHAVGRLAEIYERISRK